MKKNILDYLDNLIETFNNTHQGEFPTKIICNQETKDKIFNELEQQVIGLDGYWAETKDNFRGISIVVEDVECIKLE